MSKSDIVNKIREKLGIEAKPWTEQDAEVDPDTPIVQPNRRDKRRSKPGGSLNLGSLGKGGSGKVHDSLRLGARGGRTRKKTGSPNWFRIMKYEEARKKSLQAVTMDRLDSAVGNIATDLFRGGYKTVWDVSQVEDINELLRVGQQSDIAKGVRVKELKKLRSYLVQQRVPVKWEV